MPKIVINEFDNTEAGTGEYANFSVVVPGYLAEDKYTVDDDGKTVLGASASAVFDENGIYECTSQTDFNTYIGKRATTSLTAWTQKEPIAPTVRLIIAYDPNVVVKDNEAFTTKKEDDPVIYYYNDHSKYANAINNVIAGKYNFENGSEVPPDDVPDIKGYRVFFAIDNEAKDIGKLRDEKNKYTEVSEETETTLSSINFPTVSNDGTLNITRTSLAARDRYYIINEGDEGDDGIKIVDKITHYGNQMAYELLGLGYTVLFKYMTPYSKNELSDMVNKVEDDKAALRQVKNSTICQLDKDEFWNCLKDKSTYDFRYLVTGLLTNNDSANECIKKLADHSKEISLDDASIEDGRGDCIALIDLDKTAYEGMTQSEAIKPIAMSAAKWKSPYVAVFAPYVDYNMVVDPVYKNTIFPASFHYLACAANSANNNYSEWYANAGYTRGVSSYSIRTTGCKFGEIAIQSLEPRFVLKVGTTPKYVQVDGKDTDEIERYEAVNTEVAVNLIVNIKGSYYLWGNRTGKELGARYTEDGDLKAQHFLNIRQLCTTIKKQVYVACRRLTFDPNSNILWINFRSLLTPMLEQMKADQGIRDYEFIRNETDRKALLSAKIRIVPIEAVEDFEIGLYLEDSLAELTVTEA